MDVVWIALVITLGITVTIVFGLSYWLRGASQDAHGHLAPSHQRRFSGRPMDAPEQRQVLALLEGVKPLTRLPLRERIAALRKFMDALFVDHAHQAQFRPVQAGDVRAEWVIVPGADSSRRTLYIHGGAFMMGSPTSHRPLTEHFSRLTDGAVLAVDYRLMPEFKRSVGIEDCRSAYRWLIDNGPEGPAPVSALFVAGDSAGGNLTLSVIAWARDAGLRTANAMSPRPSPRVRRRSCKAGRTWCTSGSCSAGNCRKPAKHWPRSAFSSNGTRRALPRAARPAQMRSFWLLRVPFL
jgi:monoterpene epsilon-lactone hydrolase